MENLDKLKNTLDSILADLSAMNVAMSEAVESLGEANEHLDKACAELVQLNEGMEE